MQIEGRNIGLKNDEGDVLFDDIGFSFKTGEFSIIATDDTQKAVAFSMLATGRLRKYEGTLSIVSDDGEKCQSILGLRQIRQMTAVPFVPKIGEPDEFLTAWRVLKEEFLFAGKAASRAYILDYMSKVTGLDTSELKSVRIKDLTTTARVRIFAELATMRPGVSFIFVTLPERCGGLPHEWLRELKELQDDENAIILYSTKMAVYVLDEDFYDLDDGMRFHKGAA
jgi:integrase